MARDGEDHRPAKVQDLSADMTVLDPSVHASISAPPPRRSIDMCAFGNASWVKISSKLGYALEIWLEIGHRVMIRADSGSPFVAVFRSVYLASFQMRYSMTRTTLTTINCHR